MLDIEESISICIQLEGKIEWKGGLFVATGQEEKLRCPAIVDDRKSRMVASGNNPKYLVGLRWVRGIKIKLLPVPIRDLDPCTARGLLPGP